MTYRDLFFKLQNENNRYLNKEVIEEFLCFLGDFSTKVDLFMHFDESIINLKTDFYLEKLLKNYPIQYLTNNAHFLGLNFYVDENVLIPRQETEQLVIETSKYIQEIFGDNRISGIDIGTGSGVIGISLVLKNNIEITLSDISKNALEIASKNAKKYNANINCLLSDVFNDVPKNSKFNVIISNPPYIENENNIDKQVFDYEPHLALIAKPSTLFYELILKNATHYLKDKFIMAFEIEENMKESLLPIINKYFKDVEIIFNNDLYNRLRFLYIIKR